MTGGWGRPKAKPPSNDPGRPPKGRGSVSPAPEQWPLTITINMPVQHCPADCPCHIEENRD